MTNDMLAKLRLGFTRVGRMLAMVLLYGEAAAIRKRELSTKSRCPRLLAQANADLDWRVKWREVIRADNPVVIIVAAAARTIDERIGIRDERNDGTIELRRKAILAKT